MRKKRGWRRAAALALSAVLLAGTALALYDAIWPQQSGTDVLTSKSLVVDAGNAAQGYILARGKENKKRLKLRVTQGQYKLTYDLLSGVVEEQSQGLNVWDEDKHFVANFYKYGLVGLMLDWIQAGMTGDPQMIVDKLAVVVHGNVRGALERLSNGGVLSKPAK